MLWKCGGEDSWESLDSKQVKPVNPKGNQPWIFIGRTDAEAEAPILWPPDRKNHLFGKDLEAGKDWGKKENGVTDNEMVGWHHWPNGCEWANLGKGERQRSRACCSQWGSQRFGHKWENEEQQE